MTNLLLWLLFLQCLIVIAWSSRRRDRLIQFPFLAAAVFIGWILPQLFGLRFYSQWPEGALNKTIVMALLCMSCCWMGYLSNVRAARSFDWQLDRRRLIRVCMFLSLVGAGFYYQVGRLAADVIAEHGGQWSGTVTIYMFLSRMLVVGFVMAIVLHLDRPTRVTLVIMIFGFGFYLSRIVIHGRRAEMVELVLMALMALWFQRRWAPTRTLMASVIFAGALLVNSIGDYRSIMLGEDQFQWSGAGFDAVLDIDYIGNLEKIAEGYGGNFELTNALYEIEATDRTFDLDYGFSLWNGFVQRFVPGQLVGANLKRGMYIERFGDAERVFGYEAHTGTTVTGLTDAFQSFWFFGAIKFFLIGFIMNRWWRAASLGNRIAQMVLMLSVSSSLHAITHTTHHFFLNFVEIAAFAGPAFLYARLGRHRSVVTAVWNQRL